jgi:AcrR family transcriptional regulator
VPTRDDWLAAGLQALMHEGPAGVKIDKLSAALDASKGSFYHHFGSAKGFKVSLLRHFESLYTDRYINALEAESPPTTRAKLERLVDMVLRQEPGDRPEAVEVAVRAWAREDPDARATQERVDRRRMEYLRGLWRSGGADDAESEYMGQLMYAVLIGGAHIVPPLSPEQLRNLYELVLRLLPARQAGRRAGTT